MVIPDLSTPLLKIGDSDLWTVADATEGTLIFGGVGSAKTTGSGAMLAKTCLRNGFGGLVLCAKPNERARFESYARETGREESLVIFSPERDQRHQQQWRFNFLDYEFRRSGRGAGMVENIVELLNATKGIVAGKQNLNEDDGHWQRASNELVRNALPIIALSHESLSLDALYQLVIDAPEGDQVEDEVWKKRSFLWNCLRVAEGKATHPRDQHHLRMAKRYWLKTYAGLADRTRSSVVSTFSAIADLMFHAPMWELFNTDTTLVPETSYRDGAIIILDMPIREYGKTGIIAQSLFKYMWQHALLRRNVMEYPRPVMLFADEAQNYVSDFDFLFQSECREIRCATIAITQNINNLYAVSPSHDEVNALAANFQTKIFHANNDPTTNQWAAEAIGYSRQYRRSWGTGSNEAGNYFNMGAGEQREYQIEPAAFTTLRKGGHANDWQTEAVLFQGGRQWQATRDTWLKASIRQNNAPAPIIAPQRALTKEEQAAWFILILEWLLIFLHRGNAMDVLEAAHWQDNGGTTPPQKSLGVGVSVTSVEGDFPVPPPDIAATVQWVFGSTKDDEESAAESTN